MNIFLILYILRVAYYNCDVFSVREVCERSRPVQQHRIEVEHLPCLALRHERAHIRLLLVDRYQGLPVGAVLVDAEVRGPFGTGVCSA